MKRSNRQTLPRLSRTHTPSFESLELKSLLSGFSATWIGQSDLDRVGVGPSVGPDGYIDVGIALTGLSSTNTINSVHVAAQDGTAWEYGRNPGAFNNAELLSNTSDSTTGTLLISPLADPRLAGQVLTVTVTYGDSTTETASLTAGTIVPNLAASYPSPVGISNHAISTTWLGQDGLNLGGAGAVHLSVSNLPVGRTVVAGMLTDTSGTSWAFGSSNGVPFSTIDPNARPLTLRAGSDPTVVDLGFGPNRDETGVTMTLRLILDDGSSVIARFVGGTTNPALRRPGIDSSVYYATPADNLHTIANRYGTVYLAAGTYQLDSTLVLNNPVTIIGDPGAVLLFSQSADSPAWTTAIKVHASNTTLEGFSVRFATTIEWAPNISYGPAVIGVTDSYDVGFNDPLINLTFKNLDLESPPASSSWEEAIRLFRLVYAESGVVENNTLKGGMTEFVGGPWTISGNTYLGTVPNTYSYAVFAGHYVHDVKIVNNVILGASPGSKTWRFAVITQDGINVTVADNQVSGVGPRDDDTIPNPNASEILLTEAYRLHFEGTPSSISPDGSIVQIPFLAGPYEFVQSGDVISILSGPDAGQWRMITQTLDATTFLLDRPIDPRDTVISVASGIVNLRVTGNRFDSRGSSTADDIALVGNVYGAVVANNQIMGGKDAVWVNAAPTEFPNLWGWSHAPVMDVTIENNLFIDSIDGGVINVEHGIYVKSNLGRLYFSGTIRNNLVIWTRDFLAAYTPGSSSPTAFWICDPLSIDPAEMQLVLEGNSYLAYPGQTIIPSFKVASATINGTAMVGKTIPLTLQNDAFEDLKLINDTGIDSTDHITSDGKLEFKVNYPFLNYGYSLTGAAGSFSPISLGADSTFTVPGLVQGSNTVYIQATDAFGNVWGSSSISFILDSTSPDAPQGLRLVNDSGISQSDRVTNDATLTLNVVNSLSYEYSLTGMAGSYRPIVFQAGATFLPLGITQGTNTIYVRAVDASGNVSQPTSITLTYRSGDPSPPSGLWLVTDSGSSASDGITNNGLIRIGRSGDAAWYEYNVSGNPGHFIPVTFNGGNALSFLPSGLIQGQNTVYVRAVDLAGNRSLWQKISFTYDTVAPASVSSVTTKTNGIVTFKPVEAGATYQYRVAGSTGYVDIGAETTFRVVSTNSRPRTVYLRAIDAAGNLGPDHAIVVKPMNSIAYRNLLRSLAIRAKRAARLIHR